MKKLFLLSTICFLSSITAFSQSKQESIKELMHVMQIEETFNKLIIPNMSSQQDSLSQALYQDIIASTKPMISRMINEDMVTLYDKYYTQKEIDDIIQFYKTETGQKLIAKSADIQNEVMSIMQTKYMPEISKTIMKYTEKMMRAKSPQNVTDNPVSAQ